MERLPQTEVLKNIQTYSKKIHVKSYATSSASDASYPEDLAVAGAYLAELIKDEEQAIEKVSTYWLHGVKADNR